MNEDTPNSNLQSQTGAEERALRKQIAIEKAANKKNRIIIIIAVASVIVAAALTLIIITIINNNKKEQYSRAMTLLNAGSFSEAYEILSGLGEFGGANEIISQNEGIRALLQAREAILQKFKTKGSIVTFGNYEGNDIQWLVLSSSGNISQLISKGNVFHSKMHEADEFKYKKGPSWETSIVRETLNNSFLKGSFSESEQKAIVQSSGKDKIYIVSSISEAERLLPNEEDLLVHTEYGSVDPYWTSSACSHKIGTRWSKMSTYEKFQFHVVKRLEGDTRFDYSYSEHSEGVRPIIWVNLESTAIYERSELISTP